MQTSFILCRTRATVMQRSFTIYAKSHAKVVYSCLPERSQSDESGVQRAAKKTTPSPPKVKHSEPPKRRARRLRRRSTAAKSEKDNAASPPKVECTEPQTNRLPSHHGRTCCQRVVERWLLFLIPVQVVVSSQLRRVYH